MESFDFQMKNSVAGKFTHRMVGEIFDKQFPELNLPDRFKNFMSDELGKGDLVDAELFKLKVDEARQKNYISENEAWKIKKMVRLP